MASAVGCTSRRPDFPAPLGSKSKGHSCCCGRTLADRDVVVPTINGSESERQRWAEQVIDRLDAPMGALGILFGLLVLVETLSRPTGAVAFGFAVASWLLWAVFALEFVGRAVVAPSTSAFLRRNWWQLIFLALPFLRFLRFLRALRTIRRGARMGRVVSSMVRTSRSAGRRLTNRIGWVAIVTACVIVGGSQIVFEVSGSASYADALYAVAMATIAGEPIGEDGWMRVMDVILATYSVVIFAAVAGTIGSFLLERGREEDLLGPGTVDADDAVDDVREHGGTWRRS